ncbi:hypothetical protein [Bradyrhizobium elkanii]
MVNGAKPALSDYGIPANSSRHWTNNDFQGAFSRCAADGHREMFVPAGSYLLGEPIWMHDGITLVGENASWSVFTFYHNESGFVADGANSVGGGIKNLSVVNDSGGPATAYVQLSASVDGHSPDFFIIDGCNMTGFNGATVQYGIVVDGNARDGSAPNQLKGVRDIKFSNTDIFNTTFLSQEFRNARGVTLTNIAHYQAAVGSVAKLSITGLDAARASFNVRGVCSTFGDVFTDQASKVILSGCDLNDVVISPNTSSSRFSSYFGVVSNNGADCIVT